MSCFLTRYTLGFYPSGISPNSIRANLFAGQQCLTLANTEPDPVKRAAYYSQTISYDEHILVIHPHYRFIHEDLGYAYFGLSNYLKAADFWIQAYKLDYSNNKLKAKMDVLSDILYNTGNRKFREGEIDSAIVYFNTAIELNDKNGDAWYNLGASFFRNNDSKNGMNAWQVAFVLSPNHKYDRSLFVPPQQ